MQNKIQQAESRLPSEVQQTGVTVEKSQSNFLLIAAVYDTTDKASSLDIADWLVSNVQDPLARVEGVGSLQVFGAEYAMRIWLDPAKLASYSLMPSDVQSAIEAQNVQVTAGKIGALPFTKYSATDRNGTCAVSATADGGSAQKYYREKPVRRRSCSYEKMWLALRWAVKIIPLSANLTVTRLPGLL